MGVYIYKLQPKTRKHPVYGEVGVLKYWDKLAWFDFDDEEKQQKAVARENAKWAGRLPQFVVFHREPEVVYDFSKNGEAVYYDTESLPLASKEAA